MTQTQKGFVDNICPRPDHFCNGTFIKDRDIRQSDIGVCQYYDADLGCRHPAYPKKRDWKHKKR